ncbi:MAG TPA: LysR family transcriptional regulator [Gammaproteobacteria bacterium]|jgi:DNA-binding transcriptional LysR family regulator|nr:LysR family transcriptional regulator [Gammaproteobacteria bacterium]
MEIYQLKTFVTVAQEGTIARASERLFLSQPEVSGHIKAIEDATGLVLFERTGRGMRLTRDGDRLLVKAEETLNAHRGLLEEAGALKKHLSGKLTIGVSSESATESLGRLLSALSDRAPSVDTQIEHYSHSKAMLEALSREDIDGCFYIEDKHPPSSISTIEISRFGIFLAAPPGTLGQGTQAEPDWQVLAQKPWIRPNAHTCCAQAAEQLFRRHNFRPKNIITIDREHVMRALIAGGVGIGLLHTDTAKEACSNGDIELVCEVQKSISVMFAYLPGRNQDPLLATVSSILKLVGRA